MSMKKLPILLLALSACGSPGEPLVPLESDFALVIVKMKG